MDLALKKPNSSRAMPDTEEDAEVALHHPVDRFRESGPERNALARPVADLYSAGEHFFAPEHF